MPVAVLTLGLGLIRLAGQSREFGLTLPLAVLVEGLEPKSDAVQFSFTLADGSGRRDILPPEEYIERVRKCVGRRGWFQTSADGVWIIGVETGDS